MGLPLTPLFAVVFSVFYLFLASGVIRLRLQHRISLGSGGDERLKRRIRTQANFAEYVPLALLLFWFLEQLSYSSSLVLWLGIVLFFARIMHVIGMLVGRPLLLFRQLGVILTFGVLLVTAARLLWYYIPW